MALLHNERCAGVCNMYFQEYVVEEEQRSRSTWNFVGRRSNVIESTVD